MSSSCICVDPSDLETSAKNYEQAAQQFAMAKAQFVSAGTPNFGLILKCLEPAYEAAKQSTQEYLANVEAMLKLIASAIQGTVEDSTTTEEEILEALKKILQLLQQVDDKLDSSDPHNARSEGNGGIGGNSGYGGSFGNGGGSRADSLQSKQYQPVDQFNGRSDGGSEAAGSPASSATGSGAMASGSQEFGHDQKKTTSDGARDAAESNTYPIFNEVPLPTRPTTIGLDVDGNAKDDYSLNLTDGNTHAVIGADGSVTLTKRDNSTIPMPSDASKTGSASFDLDVDNDGVDDVSMNSDSGANARFSVYEDEDSRSLPSTTTMTAITMSPSASEIPKRQGKPCVSKPRMKPGKASQLKILWEERRMSFVPCTKTEKPFSYLNARRFNKTGCCAKHIRP